MSICGKYEEIRRKYEEICKKISSIVLGSGTSEEFRDLTLHRDHELGKLQIIIFFSFLFACKEYTEKKRRNMQQYVENNYEEICGKYEGISGKYEEICRKIPSFPQGTGIWKNSELPPRIWDLKQFRSLLFLQIQPVGETTSEVRFEVFFF